MEKDQYTLLIYVQNYETAYVQLAGDMPHASANVNELDSPKRLIDDVNWENPLPSCKNKPYVGIHTDSIL